MGYHTRIVEKSLRLGFALFLIAEFVFFFTFLVVLFYFSLTSATVPLLGKMWPPEGIVHHLFNENLNDVSTKLSFHRDSYFRLLSPYYNDSIFTQLFCQKNHFLDYQLNKCTNISFSTVDDLVCFVFGKNLNTVTHIPYEWLYLNLTVFCLWPENDLAGCHLSPYQNYERLLWPSRILTLESENCAKLDDVYCSEINLKSYFFQWVDREKMSMCEFKRDPVLQIVSFSSGLLPNPLTTPLLNAAILLTLSTYLITTRRALKLECFNTAGFFLILSIVFGLFFIYFQLYEFFHYGLSINDGIYGSLFFMLVGLHGAHVIVAVIFLVVCYLRFCYSHFTPGNHYALEAAIWYWTMIDIIWILLFFVLYLWPYQHYCASHHVDIVFNKCVEFFQPEIRIYVNIKETIYYHASYLTQRHPQYNSILFSSSLFPVSQFIIEQHWSAKSNLETINMGLYFTRIFSLWTVN